MAANLKYEQMDTFWSGILWSGSIGYIVSIVVSLGLICHVTFQYARSRKSKSKQSISSSPSIGYVLMVIYQLSVIITGMGACIRTNVLNSIGLGSEYNLTRCMVGLVIVHCFSIANYILINIFYLYGIQSIFKGTRFAYNKWVYRALVAWIIVSHAAIMIFAMVLATLPYKLQYYPGSKIAFCTYYTSDGS